MTRYGRQRRLLGRALVLAVLLPAVLGVIGGCVSEPSNGQGRVTTVAGTAAETLPAPVSGTVAVPSAGEDGTAAGDSPLFLTYQPRKCEKTPWMAWEEASGRRYIRAPSEEEIIAHYYAAEHNITVRGIAKAYLHMASCEACDVCRESYWFELTVARDEASPLREDGWQPAA